MMVETGGADVAKRLEAFGCGCGAIGRAEVEVVSAIGGVVVIIGGADTTIGGVVVIIGGADTTIGGVVVIIGGTDTKIGEATVMGAETGSERRGEDGAIGSTGCAPSPPVTPWSAVLLEIL